MSAEMLFEKQVEISIVELLYEQQLVSEDEYIRLRFLLQERIDYDESRDL